MKSLKNKVAIITGGAGSIGKETAKLFLNEGAKVLLVDMNEDQLKKTVKELNSEDLKYSAADVTKSADVQRYVKDAVKAFGKIDVFFNNAGIEGVTALTHECTEENWEKTIGINLKGVWLCMKYEIQEMLKQGKGAIVNNASIAGLGGFPGSPAYVASKHGVLGLTRTAALEYAKSGIRVNAVCPGVIQTPMIDRFTGADQETVKQFESMEPIGRMGQPEEVAEAAIWLCADAASFVTGNAMTVDGGWGAQ